MVLDHRDTTAHAGVFGGLKPLFGVGHLGGGETIYVFITFTPFQTGVGVHAVVEEGIELCFLPLELARRGARGVREPVRCLGWEGSAVGG